VELQLPHALRRHGPYAIVHPILPLAEDGSVLSKGVPPDFTALLPLTTFTPLSPPHRTRPPDPPSPVGTSLGAPRIRWNPRSPNRMLQNSSSNSELALVAELSAEPRSVIPVGPEENEGAVTPKELRQAQARDKTCSRLLALTPKGGLYDVDDRGLLVRIAPSDGSRQIVLPQGLVRRVL
jgi:hypothetical protein